MPLPSMHLFGAKQCSAITKRAKLPCKNPAAYGCRTCRMHGARKKESIKRGKQHPNFVHGRRTLAAEKESSRKLCKLRYLEELSRVLHMINGHRAAGRKPNGYKHHTIDELLHLPSWLDDV